MSDSALILAARLWLEAFLRNKVFKNTDGVVIDMFARARLRSQVSTLVANQCSRLTRIPDGCEYVDVKPYLSREGDVFAFYAFVCFGGDFLDSLENASGVFESLEVLAKFELAMFVPSGLIDGFVLADRIDYSEYKVRPTRSLSGFVLAFAIASDQKDRKVLILSRIRHDLDKERANNCKTREPKSLLSDEVPEIGFPKKFSPVLLDDVVVDFPPPLTRSDEIQNFDELKALSLLPDRVMGDLPLFTPPAAALPVLEHRVQTIVRPRPNKGHTDVGDGFRYADLPHFIQHRDFPGHGVPPSDEELSIWSRIHGDVASLALSRPLKSPIPSDPGYGVTHFNKSVHLPVPECLSDLRMELISKKIQRFNSSPETFREKHILCVNSAYRLLCEARRLRKRMTPFWEEYLALKAEVFFFAKNSFVPGCSPRQFLSLKDFAPIQVGGKGFACAQDLLAEFLPVFDHPLDKQWFALIGSALSPNVLSYVEVGVCCRVLSRMLQANRFAKGRSVADFVPELKRYHMGLDGVSVRDLRNPSTGASVQLPLDSFDRILVRVIIPASKTFSRYEGAPIEEEDDSTDSFSISVFSDLFKDLGDYPFVRNISRLVCHVALLGETLSWSGWFAHLTLMALDFDAFVLGGGFLTAMVAKLKNMRFERFEADTPAKSPMAGFFVDPLGVFANSELGCCLTDVLQSFSVVGFFSTFGYSGSEKVVKNTVEWINGLLVHDGSRRKPVDTLSDRVIKFIRVLIGKAREAIEKRDITLLFRDEITYDKWTVLADNLINMECIRLDPARPAMESLFNAQQAAGFIHPRITRQLTPSERSKELERVLDEGIAFERRYVSTPMMVGLTRARCAQVRSEIRSILTSTANSTYRQVPFGLFIHGAPGCGKTTLCSEIHSSLSHHQGLVSDETSMYRMDMASNFHDTFSEGMATVLLDDIDQSVAPESASVMNHAQIVNKLINSAPFPMEKAAVDQKGKFFANFLLALYSTNFKFANLRDRTMDTTQFWRRFPLSIEMKVQKEFANDAGGIDKDKAYVDSRLKEDIWEFEVSVFDPSQSVPGLMYDSRPYRVVATFKTKRELFASLTIAYDNFAKKERTRMCERSNAKLLPSRCSYCGFSLEAHPGEVYCEPGNIVRLESASYTEMVLVTSFVIFLFKMNEMFEWVRSFLSSPEGIPYRAAIMVWFITKWAGVAGAFGIAFGMHSDRVHRSIASYAQYAERRVFAPLWDHKGKILLALSGTLFAVKFLQKHLRSKEFLSRFQGESTPNETGFPKRRDIWGRLQPILYDRPFARAKPTYTVDEMMAVLQKRVFSVQSRFTNQRLKSFALGNGLVVLPRHLIESAAAGMYNGTIDAHPLEFYVGNGVVSVVLDPENTWVLPRRDYIVSYIPELPVFKDGWNLINELPETCMAFGGKVVDKAWFVLDDEIIPCDSRKLYGFQGRIGDAKRPEYCWRVDNLPAHMRGACGAPVVALSGDRFYIVGIHHGLSGILKTKGVKPDEKDADPNIPDEHLFETYSHLAESVCRSDIFPCLEKVRTIQPNSLNIVLDPAMVDPNSHVLRFEGLPVNSSLKVSLDRSPLPFTVFGAYKGTVHFGSTMKTNVVPTLFNGESLEQFKRFSGVVKEFAPPVFRGRMLLPPESPTGEPFYNDPHCRAAESYRNVSGDARVWRRAVADYLHGAGELSGQTGYVPLSDYATVVGIPETRAYSFDLGTSAGAPFYSSKRKCIKIVRNKDSEPEVWFDPELRAGIERILEVVDAGDVYSPPAVHCLKDEVVTKAKNLASKIRVFNIMPLAFNFLLKKYLSPIVDFFRCHPFFFEHAIGLNIAGSADARRMHDFLRVHPNICASDVSDFDVSASTRELYHASLVVQHLAHLLGYTSEERKRVWGLLMSSSNVTHISKGDFYHTNFGLASGYWITLFLNCVRNSLQARYAYYRLAKTVQPPFRHVVNQLVLGDDNISCVSDSIPWFNQVSVAEVLREIGAVRTSSRKGCDLIPYERFEDATFLKRVFRVDDGVVKCPIEKDTLVRMLSFRKRTPNLSQHDHHCVVLSTFLAESFLWGREYFDESEKLAKELISTHSLFGGSLRVFSYEEYAQRYEDGTLVTWAPFLEDVPQPFV